MINIYPSLLQLLPWSNKWGNFHFLHIHKLELYVYGRVEVCVHLKECITQYGNMNNLKKIRITLYNFSELLKYNLYLPQTGIIRVRTRASNQTITRGEIHFNKDFLPEFEWVIGKVVEMVSLFVI